jgi:hypothetical protein
MPTQRKCMRDGYQNAKKQRFSHSEISPNQPIQPISRLLNSTYL